MGPLFGSLWTQSRGFSSIRDCCRTFICHSRLERYSVYHDYSFLHRVFWFRPYYKCGWCSGRYLEFTEPRYCSDSVCTHPSVWDSDCTNCGWSDWSHKSWLEVDWICKFVPVYSAYQKQCVITRSQITGIIMALSLILGAIFLDESYPPVLLVYKSRQLRLRSGNWALHAQHEEWDVTLSELSSKHLARPFQLLMTPICFAIALYASFVYGVLYLSLASFPIEFQELRGWNPLVGALPFLGLLFGFFLGAAVNITNQRFYSQRFQANNNRPVPEARLPPMMIGSVFFAAGLFILGWTSEPHIFWFGPICGAVSTGLGFFTIFQAALNYLIDTFSEYSASAVAVNTFLRSIFAGCFPIFANAMFHKLGTAWAFSLLGFVAVALIPIPFVFYIYGPQIRARDRWSKISV